MSDTVSRISEIVADILGLEPEHLDAASGVDVTDGWDSIQHLTIMMDVEAEFGTRFSPGQLADAQTLGAIAGLIDGLV